MAIDAQRLAVRIAAWSLAALAAVPAFGMSCAGPPAHHETPPPGVDYQPYYIDEMRRVLGRDPLVVVGEIEQAADVSPRPLYAEPGIDALLRVTVRFHAPDGIQIGDLVPVRLPPGSPRGRIVLFAKPEPGEWRLLEPAPDREHPPPRPPVAAWTAVETCVERVHAADGAVGRAMIAALRTLAAVPNATLELRVELDDGIDIGDAAVVPIAIDVDVDTGARGGSTVAVRAGAATRVDVRTGAVHVAWPRIAGYRVDCVRRANCDELELPPGALAEIEARYVADAGVTIDFAGPAGPRRDVIAAIELRRTDGTDDDSGLPARWVMIPTGRLDPGVFRLGGRTWDARIPAGTYAADLLIGDPAAGTGPCDGPPAARLPLLLRVAPSDGIPFGPSIAVNAPGVALDAQLPPDAPRVQVRVVAGLPSADSARGFEFVATAVCGTVEREFEQPVDVPYTTYTVVRGTMVRYSVSCRGCASRFADVFSLADRNIELVLPLEAE